MARRKISLITGIAGFVGTHLTRELEQAGSYEIVGLRRSGEKFRLEEEGYHIPVHDSDIRDTVSVSKIVQKIQPDCVFHLAAQAFVPKAIQDPWGTMDINVRGTLNLLESLRILDKPVRMVYVSSADVYGNQPSENIPLSEEVFPNPVNPYSASKFSAEIYCRQYSKCYPNLEIMIARPFNHIGIGQRLDFVVPNFCYQIIRQIRKKGKKICVGDTSAVRDFLDVRDVVRGYRILAEFGASGEIYNICSGMEVSIREILEKLIRIAGVNLEIEVERSRIRPVETQRLVGKNEKLLSLGWRPECNLDESLQEIYHWIGSL